MLCESLRARRLSIRVGDSLQGKIGGSTHRFKSEGHKPLTCGVIEEGW